MKPNRLSHETIQEKTNEAGISISKELEGSKLGSPEAVTATAHKLARIIYAMLKNQTEYQDPGEGYYEEQARQRAIKNLKRKANQLGFQLIEGIAS